MKILVIGGGISGLSLTHYIRKFALQLHKNPTSSKFKHLKIVLVEQENRFGGKLQTQRKHIDSKTLSSKSSLHSNFLHQYELGPRALVCRKNNGTHTLNLVVNDLKLQDQILNANSQAKKRFLYLKNSLVQINPKYLLFDQLLRNNKYTLLYAIKEFLLGTKSTKSDESIYEFFKRRQGSALAQLIEPLVLGIQAGDYKILSMKSCFPQIYNEIMEVDEVLGKLSMRSEKSYATRNLVKKLIKRKIDKKILNLKNIFSKNFNKIESSELEKVQKENILNNDSAGLYSFKSKGLRTLVDALVNNLSSTHTLDNMSSINVDLRLNTSIKSFDFYDDKNKHDKPIYVSLIDKKNDQKIYEENFDYVVSTVGAGEMANVFSSSLKNKNLNSNINTSKRLADIITILKDIDNRKQLISVCSLAFDSDIIKDDLKSFGFLVPSSENEQILGVVFDSCMFKNETKFVDKYKLPSTLISVMMRTPQCKSKDKIHQIALDNVRKILLKSKEKYIRFDKTKKPFSNYNKDSDMNSFIEHGLISSEVQTSSIPQFEIGHSQRIDKLEKLIQNLSLNIKNGNDQIHKFNSFKSRFIISGSSFYGPSINSCIDRSYDVAQSLVNQLTIDN